MLSIRSLSDIVGLKRQDAWTKYACASAAAFTRAYLLTRPVPIRESEKPEAFALPAVRSDDTGERPEDREVELEESFANLIPLRHFPETLYIAPAMSKTRKQSWFLLNEGASDKSAKYVSGAWTVHEGNLYSFVDPGHVCFSLTEDLHGCRKAELQSFAFLEALGVPRVCAIFAGVILIPKICH